MDRWTEGQLSAPSSLVWPPPGRVNEMSWFVWHIRRTPEEGGGGREKRGKWGATIDIQSIDKKLNQKTDTLELNQRIRVSVNLWSTRCKRWQENVYWDINLPSIPASLSYSHNGNFLQQKQDNLSERQCPGGTTWRWLGTSPSLFFLALSLSLSLSLFLSFSLSLFFFFLSLSLYLSLLFLLLFSISFL